MVLESWQFALLIFARDIQTTPLHLSTYYMLIKSVAANFNDFRKMKYYSRYFAVKGLFLTYYVWTVRSVHKVIHLGLIFQTKCTQILDDSSAVV